MIFVLIILFILFGIPLIFFTGLGISFRDGFPRNTASRWKLAGLIIALAVGMFLYSVLGLGGLAQTSALFIGLPAAIAVTLTLLLPHARTVPSVTVRFNCIG